MATKHEELLALFRQQIRTGELRPGDKLPSITQLQQRYQVSTATIRGVMLVLKTEGLVEGRPGQGVYVRETRS